MIELKIKHGSLDATRQQGLEQITAYMDKSGADEGYLVIFDKTPGITWEEKIFRETADFQGKTIVVWGM
ncbi:MAG: hypothetical protein JXJ04_10320 [Spirochaetales bacterium]|nr:hypothetical protein [Spirochaetales bacterium]